MWTNEHADLFNCWLTTVDYSQMAVYSHGPLLVCLAAFLNNKASIFGDLIIHDDCQLDTKHTMDQCGKAAAPSSRSCLLASELRSPKRPAGMCNIHQQYTTPTTTTGCTCTMTALHFCNSTCTEVQLMQQVRTAVSCIHTLLIHTQYRTSKQHATCDASHLVIMQHQLLCQMHHVVHTSNSIFNTDCCACCRLMCMCTTTVVPFERRKLLAGSHVCESTNQGAITTGTTT